MVGRKLGLPVVAGKGALHAEEAIQAKVFKKNSFFDRSTRKFEKSVIDSADALICASEPMKDYLIQLYGISSEKITVIPNGANPVPIGDSRSGDSKEPTILYAGILDLWERVDLLIKSMHYVTIKFPDAKLLIVGDGRLKKELLNLVQRKNLTESVTFLGLKPRKETFEIMKKADVAVLPSSVDIVRKVACPIKLFDYMSMGLPIVTIDVGWWSDIVKERNAGFVAENDPKSLAEAICKAIEDKSLGNIYGNNARRIIEQEYNWLNISKNLLKVYERLLNIK